MASDNDALALESIGNYDLISKIAEGGMGAVHLARDIENLDHEIETLPHLRGDHHGLEKTLHPPWSVHHTLAGKLES